MHINDLERVLTDLGACEPAMTWLRSSGCQTFEEAWNACPRGSWLAWLAIVVGDATIRWRVHDAARVCSEVVNGLLVGAFEDAEGSGRNRKQAGKASADTLRAHVPMHEIERALMAFMARRQPHP